MKTVVTITGIRPDFIRMCKVFELLDRYFNHILIHTGQHYDEKLSGVFFTELGIREPDYVLNAGKKSKNHYEQLSYLSVEIPMLFERESINPDLIVFLGDSNSAGASYPLKKEGYKIAHIEAGMRSYDKRMLEEINRTVCDHCSDILFVYHKDYKEQLRLENITENVHVVGNTIVEPFYTFKDEIMNKSKRKDMILLDVHRPENFKYQTRLDNIFKFANLCIDKYGIPVKMLYFKRLKDAIDAGNLDLGKIELIDLLPFKKYLDTVYHSLFIISDSGTGQEEPALLNTPVVVPRDFTERPQSYQYNCSVKICVEGHENTWNDVFEWLNEIHTGMKTMDTEWLGKGNTSCLIVNHLRQYLNGDLLSPIFLSSDEYQSRSPFPYMYQDDFIRFDYAKKLQAEILSIPIEDWDRYNNPFEQKYTLRDKFNFPPLLKGLFEELMSDKFVEELSELCGYPLILDKTRNFWGVHKYDRHDKLDIHVDASVHPNSGLKKQITLGIYLSSNWSKEYGCDLELWEGDNASSDEAKIYNKIATVSPIFNRLVIFTCNDYSWHGNPIPTTGPEGSHRIFVTISYLSNNKEYDSKRSKAFFVPRPDDPIDEKKDKLRFLRADSKRYKDIYRISNKENTSK